MHRFVAFHSRLFYRTYDLKELDVDLLLFCSLYIGLPYTLELLIFDPHVCLIICGFADLYNTLSYLIACRVHIHLFFLTHKAHPHSPSLRP
jgi:hypothetical protein